MKRIASLVVMAYVILSLVLVTGCSLTNTVAGTGKALKPEDIKSVQLYNLEQNLIKDYDYREIKEIIDIYNNSRIDNSAYIEMITGNTMIITLKNDSVVRLTSYGSDKNIVASGETNGEYYSFHLVCPQIARILLATGV